MDIELLHPDRLTYWCGRLRMPPDAEAALARIARLITASPELLRQFTALHETYVLRGEWPKEWGPHPVDPAVEAALGPESSIFYLLVYMSGLPHADEQYRRLDVSQEIVDATFYDITFYLLELTGIRGAWSFDEFGWIKLHLTSRIFRLGRLQYVLKDYDDHAQAFRHLHTGEYRLLCGPGLTLQTDPPTGGGIMTGAGLTSAEKEAAELNPSASPDGETWQTVFAERPDGWFGHPVAPRGYALPEPTLLSRAEWSRCLTQGDTVLDIHIPRGKTLTAEECRASFCEAYQFFPRRWPERAIKASFCHTWFFTPQLQTILPLESSIVRFQREFYLYPNRGGPEFLWRFVFGGAYPTPETAPRDTFLRRAVLDWLASGNRLYDLPGLRFHPPETWGTQPYMTAWGQ